MRNSEREARVHALVIGARVLIPNRRANRQLITANRQLTAANRQLIDANRR